MLNEIYKMLHELYKLTNSFYYWLITSTISLVTIFYKLFMIFYKKSLCYQKSLLAKDIGTDKSSIIKIYRLSRKIDNDGFKTKLLEKYNIDEQLLRKLENKNYIVLESRLGVGIVAVAFNNAEFNYNLCKAVNKYKFKKLEDKMFKSTENKLNSSNFAKEYNIDKYVADKMFEYFCYQYPKQFLKSNISSNDVNISIALKARI